MISTEQNTPHVLSSAHTCAGTHTCHSAHDPASGAHIWECVPVLCYDAYQLVPRKKSSAFKSCGEQSTKVSNDWHKVNYWVWRQRDVSAFQDIQWLEIIRFCRGGGGYMSRNCDAGSYVFQTKYLPRGHTVSCQFLMSILADGT